VQFQSDCLGNVVALPNSGDVVGGKYLVQRLLGTGAMGAVFEVSHCVTEKRFAIKWLLAEAASEGGVKRFTREAQVAGRFEHPNVVEVYDIGQQDDSFYMVMELLEGESLAERLERVGRMSVSETLAIAIPCMEGVAAAHSAGIVHRDLKPANIYLRGARGREPELPKVLDFGISKMSSRTEIPEATLTERGAVMGTPYYMAPEQMRGHKVDERVDVYAFGVILYEMLSGRRPFAAATYADLVFQVMAGTPTPLRELAPNLPPGLAPIVARAMARVPDARFASVQALIHALASFHPELAGTLIESATRPRAEPDQRSALGQSDRPSNTQLLETTRGTQRSRRVALALGALGILVGIAYMFVRQEQPEPSLAEPAAVSGAAISGYAPADKPELQPPNAGSPVLAVQPRAALPPPTSAALVPALQDASVATLPVAVPAVLPPAPERKRGRLASPTRAAAFVGSNPQLGNTAVSPMPSGSVQFRPTIRLDREDFSTEPDVKTKPKLPR